MSHFLQYLRMKNTTPSSKKSFLYLSQVKLTLLEQKSTYICSINRYIIKIFLINLMILIYTIIIYSFSNDCFFLLKSTFPFHSMAVFGSLEQSCNLKDSYITCIMYEVLNKVYLKKITYECNFT
jgi:hypothetical protein